MTTAPAFFVGDRLRVLPKKCVVFFEKKREKTKV
jgi:hypothetical protein